MTESQVGAVLEEQEKRVERYVFTSFWAKLVLVVRNKWKK